MALEEIIIDKDEAAALAATRKGIMALEKRIRDKEAKLEQKKMHKNTTDNEKGGTDKQNKTKVDVRSFKKPIIRTTNKPGTRLITTTTTMPSSSPTTTTKSV